MFSIDIIDEEGTDMSANFYMEAAKEWFDKLAGLVIIAVGKVYEFGNGKVKMSDGKYKKNDYQISFDLKSSIKEVADNKSIGISARGSWTKIAQILQKAVKTVVDLTAIVMVF